MTVVSMVPVTRRVVLALSVLGSALACATPARTTHGAAGRMPGEVAQVGAAGVPAIATTTVTAADAVLQPIPQQLIRRGDMAVAVDDVVGTARHVERLAAMAGGVVARSSDDGDDDAMVEMRVPSDRLDATMDSVATLGHVERRATNSEDVTEQVLDLDARIATLTATRDRLRQLLTRSDAVRDVIEVERELARVQSDLESLDRRVTQLRGQVAMSNLSVKIGRRVVLGPIGALLKGIGVVIGKLFVW